MPFIGNQPALSYTSFAKQDFTTSATTSYTLDHPVTNENEIALFINFVRQEPTTAYSASGTSLTLTSATSATDDMYCVFLGKAVQTVNPPNSSVGSSQVSADLITGQSALGATPADTDELLISDAGTLKRVDYSYLKSANTPAFITHLNADQSISDSTFTQITFTETYDSDNAFASNTFTVPSGEGGKYFISISARISGVGNDVVLVRVMKNSTTDVLSGRGAINTTSYGLFSSNSLQFSGILDLSVGDTLKVEAYGRTYDSSNSTVEGDSAGSNTWFHGYKLIGI